MPLTQTWTGDTPSMVLLLGILGIVTGVLYALSHFLRSMPTLVPIPIRTREAERRLALARARARRRALDD
ncbi:MAG: hypothetical protein HQL97_11335 [Magnetococcales bacterium]|nr:hypothetical protein [Magnetococcales bacterium]MBF0262410.1 hypothetical protein [Magnetococcales bacterium]